MYISHPFILSLIQISLLQETYQSFLVILNHEAPSCQVLYKFGQCMDDDQHFFIIDWVEPLSLPYIFSPEIYQMSVLHQYFPFPFT
jgi:hypothetical protein